MIVLDNQFLEEVGLGDLPADERRDFLRFVYDELELRVGEALASDLPAQQLMEFEKIASSDFDFIRQWLNQVDPEFKADPEFAELIQKTGYDAADNRLEQEYATSKWLSLNCPNYTQTVRDQMDSLQKEIVENRDKLLK